LRKKLKNLNKAPFYREIGEIFKYSEYIFQIHRSINFKGFLWIICNQICSAAFGGLLCSL